MQEKESISYYAHEGMMARMERANRRLWIVILVLILALIASNGAWIWYESQWEPYEESITQEVTQETGNGGDNHFIGGDYNGETNSKDNKNTAR